MTPALIRELPRLEDLYEPGLQLRQGDDHVLHAVLGEKTSSRISLLNATAMRKAEMIWNDTRKYPTYTAVAC